MKDEDNEDVAKARELVGCMKDLQRLLTRLEALRKTLESGPVEVRTTVLSVEALLKLVYLATVEEVVCHVTEGLQPPEKLLQLVGMVHCVPWVRPLLETDEGLIHD